MLHRKTAGRAPRASQQNRLATSGTKTRERSSKRNQWLLRRGIHPCSVQMSADSGSWAPESESTVGTKLLQKARKSPLVPVGMVGFVAVAAYGLFQMKDRGSTKMSVHLIHTRVAAQACLVGAVTLGAVYSMYKDHFRKEGPVGPPK
ncbi:HIG1 domain family member 1B [Paroedura picta]|uniref:HIG1 domain family member 1B n=1 Tax=Paroedura picta TaxID=143630 RepID=UPI004055B512